MRFRTLGGLGLAALIVMSLGACAKGAHKAAQAARTIGSEMRDTTVAKMGAHLTDTGNVVVELPACYDHSITQVVLSTEKDAETLWKLDAAEGVRAAPITLGMVPAGFSESVALRRALPPDALLHVSVLGQLKAGTGPPFAEVDFTIEQLRKQPIHGGCN